MRYLCPEDRAWGEGCGPEEGFCLTKPNRATPWSSLGYLLTLEVHLLLCMNFVPPVSPSAAATSLLPPSWLPQGSMALPSVLPEHLQPQLWLPPRILREVPECTFQSGLLEGRGPLIRRSPAAPTTLSWVPLMPFSEGDFGTSPRFWGRGSPQDAGVTGTSQLLCPN